jgi:hypothetical protein
MSITSKSEDLVSEIKAAAEEELDGPREPDSRASRIAFADGVLLATKAIRQHQNVSVPWKAELVAEAREAIANAKRKHQRWAIWERIVDEWECMPDEYEPIADARND